MESKNELLFANRCKSIPVVNSTCYWLNEYYNRVKEINMLTKYTMQLAETTIKTSICIANPFVEKFKTHVQALDSIACHQLDKLEAAFPILLEDTTKVVNEGKIFLTKTVRPAVSTIEDRYLELKKHNCVALQTKTNRLIKQLLDSSERFIEAHFLDDDHKLIRTCYQQQPSLATSIELASRARTLTCTLYLAVQRKCLRQINFLMHSLDAHLDRLNRLVDLLDRQKIFVKTQFQSKMSYTRQRMTFYREYLELLTKQMMVQDGRSLDHVHSVEERSKILIRRTLGNFLTALYLVYKKLNSLSINMNLRDKFFRVMERLVSSYKCFQKANVGLNERVLYDCRVILHSIQISLESFLTLVSKTSVATWLVPNFDVFGVINGDDEDTGVVDVQERELKENLKAVIELENSNMNEMSYCTETSTPKMAEMLNKSLIGAHSNTPVVSRSVEVEEEQNASTSTSDTCEKEEDDDDDCLNATANSSTVTFEEIKQAKEEEEEKEATNNENATGSTSTLDTSSQKMNTTTTTTTSESESEEEKEEESVNEDTDSEVKSDVDELDSEEEVEIVEDADEVD